MKVLKVRRIGFTYDAFVCETCTAAVDLNFYAVHGIKLLQYFNCVEERTWNEQNPENHHTLFCTTKVPPTHQYRYVHTVMYSTRVTVCSCAPQSHL